MNKGELKDAVAKASGLSGADAERALDAVLDTITKAVADGDKVTIPGFGTFRSASARLAPAATRRPVPRSPSPRPACRASRRARSSSPPSPAPDPYAGPAGRVRPHPTGRDRRPLRPCRTSATAPAPGAAPAGRAGARPAGEAEERQEQAERDETDRQQRRRPDRHPTARRADARGPRGRRRHHISGPVTHMKMTARHISADAPERPQPEAAALVQPDALGDDLGQQRVVGEAVGRLHLAAVASDVHGLLVRRARRRRSRSPRTRRWRRPAPAARPCRGGAAPAGRRPRWRCRRWRRCVAVSAGASGTGGVLLGPRHVLRVAVRQRLVERGGRVALRARVEAPQGGALLGGEGLHLLAPEAGPGQPGHQQGEQADADEGADQPVPVAQLAPRRSALRARRRARKPRTNR